MSAKEIEQLVALVQQGIGFNAERGDAVKVINAPFRVEPAPAVEELPLWRQPWLLELLRSAAAPLALALVALVIVFKLVKPALVALLAPPPPPGPGSQLNEVVQDNVFQPAHALPPPQVTQQAARLEAARALAKQNPAAVASIVRGWVSGEST